MSPLMKNKLNRTIYRIVLIASFLAINALIISGISAVLAYLNTGADKASILHLEVPMEKIYTPKVIWGNLENPARPMEKQTLQEIERDYLNAWHVRNIALKENDRYGVSDFYTDSARLRIFEHIDLNVKNDTYIKATTLSHHPELDFYSEDGTLVVFTDKNVERYQETYYKDSLFFRHKDTLNYQLMMLLEDGFWRIRHLQEIEIEKKRAKRTIKNIDSILQSIPNLNGLNYYPKNSPWDTFGKKFNDTIIDKDFEIISKMGLNTIRIFVQYDDFGKADVASKKLDRLRKILDLAQKQHLKVMVTLFDFYGDYDITNWTLTQRHAETIIKSFNNHNALLAWDIKNEPDLDFDSRGKQRVLSWLNEMVEKIHEWDPDHPVTIGWSSPEAAIHLADKVDFVSYHFYRKPKEFLEAHNNLKSQVKHKPIVLQEYGYSSYDGFWNLYTGSDDAQAAYYEDIQDILVDHKIPFLFWTLYDFDEVPIQVAGRLPWRTRKQHYFGLFDTEHRQKPAYQVLVQEK